MKKINIPDELHSLHVSIQSSPQVYLWAYMVVDRQKYKIKYINDNKITNRAKYIQKFNSIKKVLWLISLLLWVLGIHSNRDIPFYIGIIALFIVTLYIPSKIKEYIADISCYFIKKNTAEYRCNRESLSMFTITEKYSQAHKIPSLIDLIVYIDSVERIGGIIGIGVIISLYTVYPKHILYIIMYYYFLLYLISRCYIKLSVSPFFITIKKLRHTT